MGPSSPADRLSDFAALVPGETESSARALSPRMQAHLRKTRPWLLVVAIAGIVVGGLIFAGGVISILSFAYLPFKYILFRSLINFAMSVCLGLPAIFLLSAYRHTGRYVKRGAAQNLADAMSAQRRFWTVTGVLVILLFLATILTMFAPILFFSF